MWEEGGPGLPLADPLRALMAGFVMILRPSLDDLKSSKNWFVADRPRKAVAMGPLRALGRPKMSFYGFCMDFPCQKGPKTMANLTNFRNLQYCVF